MAKTRIERRCDIRDANSAKAAIVQYCGSIGYELVQQAGNRIVFRFTRARFWATRTSDYWHRLTVTLTGASVLCEFGGWMNPDKALAKSSTDFDRIATGIVWSVDATATRTTFGAGERVWVERNDGPPPGGVDWEVFAAHLRSQGEEHVLEQYPEYAEYLRGREKSPTRRTTAEHELRESRSSKPRAERSDAPQVIERVVEHTIERQVVVTRCKFCQQLTPVDLERCANCGAMKFG